MSKSLAEKIFEITSKVPVLEAGGCSWDEDADQALTEIHMLVSRRGVAIDKKDRWEEVLDLIDRLDPFSQEVGEEAALDEPTREWIETADNVLTKVYQIAEVCV